MTTIFKEPRIATKRLRAAITKVNNARKFGIGVPVHPATVQDKEKMDIVTYLKALGTYNKEMAQLSADRATKLYSLRSHLRGTLHITHQYVQHGLSDGRCMEVCLTRTMEDQAKLIEPLVEEFKMTPEELAKFESDRRHRTMRYGTPEEIAALDPVPSQEEVHRAQTSGYN